MIRFKLLFISSFFFVYPIWAQTSVKLVPGSDNISIISSGTDNDWSAAEKAFDGDFSTHYASPSSKRSNAYVGLDLGDPYVITKVAYAACSDHPGGDRIQLGYFEGANREDFMDGVPLLLITDKSASGVLTEQEINNSRGFRYLRYYGPHDSRCHIAELEFYGYKSIGDDSQLTQISNIPDVIIHTENGEEWAHNEKEVYRQGAISFIYNNGKSIQYFNTEMRGRGNASWGFEKKPYRIKLEKKQRVMDFPAEARNWTLISNEGDKTLIRNLLAFDLSKRFDMPYTPAGRLVNVFLNGEYKGCYQLCDHIDVRENRVNVVEMKENDVAGDALTGGYLIELDAYAGDAGQEMFNKSWFYTYRSTPVTIKSPDDDNITPEQFQYIKNYTDKWQRSILSSDYKDPITGYRSIMDTETFLRHFLVGEFTGNTDTYWSVYMYKQRQDPLFYFGPCWDFDLAYVNDERIEGLITNPNRMEWVYTRGSSASGVNTLVNRLLEDEDLKKELKQIWADYRNKGIITESELLQTVDDYVDEIYDSQELNFIRWKYRNLYRHMMRGRNSTYEGDIDIVKNYIINRLAWMDNMLDYTFDSSKVKNQQPLNIMAVVSKGMLHIKSFWGSYEIYNMMGQVYRKGKISGNTSLELPSGMYLLRLIAGEYVTKQKLFVP
jgi:hypothetical protein